MPARKQSTKTRPPMEWAEHLARAAEAFADEMRGKVPDDFSKHARGSIKEALLAVRSLIDNGIDCLDEKPKKSRSRRKVKVE